MRFCVIQFAGVSGEMCNQGNLHRTGHIQICKQGMAGYHFQTFLIVLDIFLNTRMFYQSNLFARNGGILFQIAALSRR